MAELFKKNYKSLYICSFIYTIIQLLAVIDFYQSSTDDLSHGYSDECTSKYPCI